MSRASEAVDRWLKDMEAGSHQGDSRWISASQELVRRLEALDAESPRAESHIETSMEQMERRLNAEFGERKDNPVPYLVADMLHDRGRIKDPELIAQLVADRFDEDLLSKIVDEIEDRGVDTPLELDEAKKYLQSAADELMSADGLGMRDPLLKEAVSNAIAEVQAAHRRVHSLLEDA